MNESLLPRRLSLLAGVGMLAFIALVARLWFLQVMQAPTFQEAAAENRTREIITEAPRGLILDANDRVLAGRRESRVVTLDWTQLRDFSSDERAEIFAEVAAELNRAGEKTKVDELEEQFQSAQSGSLKPEAIAEDISPELWVSIQELALPGFAVEQRWVRVYPYGEVGGNILGYTGNVGDQATADELNAKNNDDKVYLPGDELGRAGIESLFESTLRGTPEIRVVEIDAQNRIIGTVEVIQPAVPGQNVHLALDIDLQYAAEQILADELRLARSRQACSGCRAHVADAGALVAVDATNGTVTALATYPSYDPSDFVFGMSADQYQSLLDRPDTPLIDRTIKGLYPAGSTFKHITAYAALTSGARGEWELWEDEGVFEIENCSSAEQSGCQWRNAGNAVFGPVDLRTSIEVSSDTYYYSLGEQFWIHQEQYGETIMQDTALAFGFGTSTGIQLPEERGGRVPTPENRHEEFGEDHDWFTGDNINLSIGQGDLLVTPLQLADSYATLATGGIRYQPRLVASLSDPVTGEVTTEFQPRVVADDPLRPFAVQAIEDGMVRVTVSGTAEDAFAGFPLDSYPIAGKTGTAEVARKADYALFAGYGPVNDPKYAVAAVLEQAGFGGDAAAPAVRRFFDLLAGNMPIQPAPLAGEPAVSYDRPPQIDGLPLPVEEPEEPTDAETDDAATAEIPDTNGINRPEPAEDAATDDGPVDETEPGNEEP